MNLQAVVTTAACAAWLGMSALNAQVFYDFTLDAGPQVAGPDGEMVHPFAGGVSQPMWSEIDFDGDGDLDFFCFEKDFPQHVLMFEREADGTIRENLSWEAGWPELGAWALLRDYDCDGLPDLFTGNQNSVTVFHNEGGPGANFSLAVSPLMASWDFGSGPSELPVVVLSIDKPAITDIDGDGAIDIVTFTETSSSLYAFKGLEPCGLDFECANRCYAMVGEGAEDNTLFIGDAFECDFNVADPGLRPGETAERDGLHAGGAVTMLELDGAGDMDILVSDVIYPTIAALLVEEGGSGLDSTAWVDMAFPALLPHEGPADSVNLERFPAGYPVDADGDGDLDLVFSPNTPYDADDDRCVHLWRNEGTAEAPLWAFVQDDWVQGGMIDVGRGARPQLVDLDGDGLLDLAIGNKERHEGIGSTPTDLALFRNVGTATEPAFEWVTWNAIDFALNGIESAFPAFGDIDADGDVDLIVGDELGLLHRYENVAGPGAWPAFELAELGVDDAAGENIDLGQFCAPQLLDLNGDDLLDLIVGERNGNVNLLLNVGTPTSPQWSLVSEVFGAIQVDNFLGIQGYSTPCLYEDGSGIHLWFAGETGRIEDYGIWPVGSTAWDAVREEVSEGLLGSYRSGAQGVAAVADLTADGLPELIIGSTLGGLRYFSGTGVGVSETSVEVPEVRVWPQPVVAGSAVQVEMGQVWSAVTFRWIDAAGRVMPSNSLQAPDAPGHYVLEIGAQKTGAQKTGTSAAALIPVRVSVLVTSWP